MRGQNNSRIIVALDVPTVVEATRLVAILEPHVAGFKVGPVLKETMLSDIATATSSQVAGILANQQWNFWQRVMGGYMDDPKLNDTPDTMRGASCAIAQRRPRFLTVHASSGTDGMKAAMNGAGPPVQILAVTVLTTLGEQCRTIFGADPKQEAIFLTDLAANAGVPGIVCSGKEVQQLKGLRPKIVSVVPGTRSQGAKHHDQVRVVTPAEAIQSGADYVVIGREITGDEYPVNAAQRINADIAAVLAELGKEA